MTGDEKKLIAVLRTVLTPDLIPEQFKEHPENPMFGHCYGAAEALYRLLGGKEQGYKAQRATDSDGVSHWWVLSPTGCILDPTSTQCTDFVKIPPYAEGRGASFRSSSKRATTIMERVEAIMSVSSGN